MNLGKTLNLRFFGVCVLTKIKVDPESSVETSKVIEETPVHMEEAVGGEQVFSF